MGCINSSEANTPYCPCSFSKKNKVSPLPQVEVAEDCQQSRGHHGSPTLGQEVATAAPAGSTEATTSTHRIKAASPGKVAPPSLTKGMTFAPMVKEVEPATPIKVVQSKTPVPEVKPATTTTVVESTTPAPEAKPATPAKVVQPTLTVVRPATHTQVVESTTLSSEVKPATPAQVVQPTLTMVRPASPTEVVESTTSVPEVKPSTPAKVVQPTLTMLRVVKSSSTPAVKDATPFKSIPSSVAASHLLKEDRASRSLYRATMAQDLEAMLLQLDWASIKVPEVQRSDVPRVPGQIVQLLTSEQLQCLGLPNLGQSCYLNATIQCMLRMEGFCQELLQQQHIWRSNAAASLLKCFVEVRAARYAHRPAYKRGVLKALLGCVAEEAGEFADGGQKDAHEFFCATVAQMAALAPLLEGGALGVGAYTCPVRTNLHFQMLSIRTCRQCGLESSRQEDFTNLSLAMVAGRSVEACLQQHLQESELEFRCSCGGHSSGLRWSFLTLPRVMVFHLNRFCRGAGWQLEKSEEPVLLSRELLLRSGPSGDEALVSGAGQEQGQNPGCQGHTQDETRNAQLARPHASVHVSTEEGSDREGSCLMGSRYSLVGVLSHIGSSTTSGHYISDCHHSDGDPEDQTDRWLSYNDDIVTETTGELVCERRQRSAYLLFYERQ